jgi:hypothetical protein
MCRAGRAGQACRYDMHGFQSVVCCDIDDNTDVGAIRTYCLDDLAAHILLEFKAHAGPLLREGHEVARQKLDYRCG